MTWESYPAWIWFAVESHMAVICASIPALNVYFKKLLSMATVTGSRLKSGRNGYERSSDAHGPSRSDKEDSKISKGGTYGELELYDLTVDSERDSATAFEDMVSDTWDESIHSAHAETSIDWNTSTSCRKIVPRDYIPGHGLNDMREHHDGVNGIDRTVRLTTFFHSDESSTEGNSS
jgi:hypothetical protein